jgi:hypothetical protein
VEIETEGGKVSTAAPKPTLHEVNVANAIKATNKNVFVKKFLAFIILYLPFY